VKLLRMGNEDYWVVKHFNEKTLTHIQNRFDEDTGKEIINTWKRLCGEATELQRSGAAPESKEGQALAKAWWDMVMEFTGGDISLLPELTKFFENRDGWNEDLKENMEVRDDFIPKTMQVYFTNLGYNPFMGTETDLLNDSNHI